MEFLILMAVLTIVMSILNALMNRLPPVQRLKGVQFYLSDFPAIMLCMGLMLWLAKETIGERTADFRDLFPKYVVIILSLQAWGLYICLDILRCYSMGERVWVRTILIVCTLLLMPFAFILIIPCWLKWRSKVTRYRSRR